MIPGVTFRFSKRTTHRQYWGAALSSLIPPSPPPSPAQRLTGDPVGMLSGWGLSTPFSLYVETPCLSSHLLPCSCLSPWPRRVWRWAWVGGGQGGGSGRGGPSSCCLAFPQLSNPAACSSPHALILLQMIPHPEEVPVPLGPDLLTVRKSGVSRTHSLPNDSYMCRNGSTSERALGHRGWGLPKAQSGTEAGGKPALAHTGRSSLP